MEIHKNPVSPLKALASKNVASLRTQREFCEIEITGRTDFGDCLSWTTVSRVPSQICPAFTKVTMSDSRFIRLPDISLGE